jgi:predicted chitinase
MAKLNLDHKSIPYYGPGYVQLTWKNNYQKYSQILGADLENNSDLAMEENIALFVLVHGFKVGTFTGFKIADFINRNQTDFVGARRCINGTDRAHEIASLAEDYLR